MKKLLSTFILSASLCSLNANDGNESDLSTYNITLEAGYTSQLVVNGVARHGDRSAFAGFGFNKPLSLLDVHGSALLVPEPNGDSSQSHWNLGVGKDLAVGNWGLGLEADVAYRQHAAGIPDSTELSASASLLNPLATPFVRVLSDLDLEQDGFSVGLTKSFDVLGADSFSLNVAPVVEWFEYTDYSSFTAALDLNLTVENGFFSHFQPFGSISYVDSDIDTADFNFASDDLDGDVNVTVGLKYSF
tara:strand:+ start:5699 stop:6436 length:738 start_codon:yes stop_codon:yes gene_type:complete